MERGGWEVGGEDVRIFSEYCEDDECEDDCEDCEDCEDCL